MGVESGRCRVRRFYRFHGSCTSGVLPPGGATYTLAEYRGLRARFTIPKNDGNGAFTFTFADATGRGDIGSFHGKRFPKYPRDCKAPSCPGTAFIYVAVSLAGPDGLITKGRSIFSFVDDGSYTGSTCREAILRDGGWIPFGPFAHPRGRTLTFRFAESYMPSTYATTVFCKASGD